MLADDIEQDRFQAVREKYESDVGDYMFIASRRPANWFLEQADADNYRRESANNTWPLNGV